MAFVRWNQTTNIWELAATPENPSTAWNHLPIQTPTQPLDTANKAYVDSLVGGGPFVPYNGASANVNLNTQQLIAGNLSISGGPGSVAGQSFNFFNGPYGLFTINNNNANVGYLAFHFGGVVAWQVGYRTGSNLGFSPAPPGVAMGVPVIQFSTAGEILERSRAFAMGDWIAVPFSDLSFSASGSMVWNVVAGNVSYFRYSIVGKTMFIRGAITGTSTSGTASSGLRVGIAGITFTPNDSFGMTVYSDNGFATQGLGQSIARVAGNFLEFKHIDGSNWPIASGIAVIFNLVVEMG